MDMLESTSQSTPTNLLRDKDRMQFSYSVETGQGDNPRSEHTFPTLSVTGFSPIYRILTEDYIPNGHKQMFIPDYSLVVGKESPSDGEIN